MTEEVLASEAVAYKARLAAFTKAADVAYGTVVSSNGARWEGWNDAVREIVRKLRRLAGGEADIPGPVGIGYDRRITCLAAIAAKAAAKNAGTVPQLLMADITFALADAVEDGRIILGRGDIAKARGSE